MTKMLSLISYLASQQHAQDSNRLWQNQGSFMPAVSHQCHPSAASVSCNSVSPEPRCKSVSCCSNVKYVKPGDSLTCQPSLSHTNPACERTPDWFIYSQMNAITCIYPRFRKLKRSWTGSRWIPDSPFQEWCSSFSSRSEMFKRTSCNTQSRWFVWPVRFMHADRTRASQGRSWLHFTLMKSGAEFISERRSISSSTPAGPSICTEIHSSAFNPGAKYWCREQGNDFFFNSLNISRIKT